MGLDNGFILRDTQNNTDIELFSFRNYYELAGYFRAYKMLPSKEDDETPSYEYSVTESRLKDLLNMLQPIYDKLVVLPDNTVAYYDENGYPPKYRKLFYGKTFDPASTSTSFAGAKLMRLYQRVGALLEILENLKYRDDDCYQLVFYDSY